MIEQISTLIERNRRKQIRLREAELEVLQTQINPHFLYNTLDTIVWLAEAGRQNEVVQMVEDLSDFFRSTLNNGKDVTLVEQEFVHAESYLKIQKIRYQDILCYDMKLPPSLKNYRIPKITLQPLVENALYHGIKNKRGKGTIRVGGREEENRVVLFVKDDGIGMKKERLEQIRESLLPDAEPRSDSYGLCNVNERLRLRFGAEYHLEIESEYGEGTTVWIYLPKELREEDIKQADGLVR
jgi:two-component system sensor histidine kinase YesM